MHLSPPLLKNLKRKISSVCGKGGAAKAQRILNGSSSSIMEDRFIISHVPIASAILVPDSSLLDGATHDNGFQLKKRFLNSSGNRTRGKVLLADLQLDLDIVSSEAFERDYDDPEVRALSSAFSEVSHGSKKTRPQ
jgi:hypothetical protein